MFARDQVLNSSIENYGEECDTLFYQGMGSSQTQALKYIGEQKIQATTGEMMWCTGRNNLKSLKVIYKLFIGTEIADVNLHPFDTIGSRFNPLKLVNSAITYTVNRRNGTHIQAPTIAKPESVAFHTTKLSEFSLGQKSDIESLQKKYELWLAKENRTKEFIAYGVSRGTIATFCWLAQRKPREVKLVVLEGAVDSIPEVLKKMSTRLRSDSISRRFMKCVDNGFTFFEKRKWMQYRADGPSPLNSVAEFPEGVPVVFITSKGDTVVSATNTQNIAQELVKKGKNDVYLLTLERAAHPNYMFDNAADHDRYETFLHAVYKKYNLKHDPALAQKGEELLKVSTLYECNPAHSLRMVQ